MGSKVIGLVEVIVSEGGHSVRLEFTKLVVVGCNHVGRQGRWLLRMPAIRHSAVQAGGIPRGRDVGGQEFGEGAPFVVSVGMKLDVRESIAEGHRNAVSFEGFHVRRSAHDSG